MKKLVFVSFAMSVLGGISESAHGMFNAQDETQNADNGKLLTHEKLPENEREEGHQSESYNYQIGDLRAQVSRLTALVETSLANEERKNKEKDQSEVYNYQIGDLKAQISRLTALAETSLADKERKSKEKDQSEVYNYQIGNLGAQISRLTTLVQDLNEKVMVLSEERESLIAGNVVKSQESTEQKEEAKSTSELEQQKLAQAEKSEESSADELAENKEKTISKASTKIDIDSLTYVNAKSAVEKIFTELLNVAGKEALQKRHQEFSVLVISNSAKGWKIGWRGKKDISIENDGQGNFTVKFKDPKSQVHPFGVDRIKSFLKEVQTQINDTRSCAK